MTFSKVNAPAHVLSICTYDLPQMMYLTNCLHRVGVEKPEHNIRFCKRKGNFRPAQIKKSCSPKVGLSTVIRRAAAVQYQPSYLKAP